MIFSVRFHAPLDLRVIFIKKPSICSTDGFFDFSSSVFTPMKGGNYHDDNDDYFRL